MPELNELENFHYNYHVSIFLFFLILKKNFNSSLKINLKIKPIIFYKINIILFYIARVGVSFSHSIWIKFFISNFPEELTYSYLMIHLTETVAKSLILCKEKWSILIFKEINPHCLTYVNKLVAIFIQINVKYQEKTTAFFLLILWGPVVHFWTTYFSVEKMFAVH